MVCKEGSIPQEWKDALVVPIPKKGDLFPSVTIGGELVYWTWGKLFSKIIQQRPQCG